MKWLQQAQEVGVMVEEPLVLADANSHPWDERTDLVVVGLGAAGVVAALEAVEAGLQVFALDRYEGGGTTVVSSGVVHAGGGTYVQQQAGVVDSPQEMFRYLQTDVGDAVPEAVLRDFAEQSAATLAWLSRHGVRFVHSRTRKAAPDAPAETADALAQQEREGAQLRPPCSPAQALERSRHLVLGHHTSKTWGLGAALYGPLRDAALQAGMEFAPYSEVRQLVQDAQGRVVGVKVVGLQTAVPSAVLEQLRRYASHVRWWQALLPPSMPFSKLTYGMAKYYLRQTAQLLQRWQQVRWIRADHGVLLSAGGFVLNPRMVQRYVPDIASCLPNGTSSDNGSGILLGMSAGGAVARMEQSSVWRFFGPTKVWRSGVAVNQQGERFANEAAYSAVLGERICAQPQGRAWLIYDASLRRVVQAQLGQSELEPFMSDVVRLNLWFNAVKAPSLKALARKLRLPDGALEATVAQYNRVFEGEGQDAQGKAAQDIQPLCAGPFYAMDIGVHSKWMPMVALPQGGLRVQDNTGLVLDVQGRAIAGLYAAGRSAVGLTAGSRTGGMALADSIYSGRRAARAVVQTMLAEKKRPAGGGGAGALCRGGGTELPSSPPAKVWV